MTHSLQVFLKTAKIGYLTKKASKNGLLIKKTGQNDLLTKKKTAKSDPFRKHTQTNQ